MPRTRVTLPAGCRPPFEIYLNGVPQEEGRDFHRRGAEIVFDRELRKEGKLGLWRWLLGAFGVGTYRQNDVLDVRYERGGVMTVGHDLPFGVEGSESRKQKAEGRGQGPG
jgi:hypothetical protein